MADSKMGLDAPMGLLTQITHYTHTKLMVWNMYSFAVISSNDSWWPPANMLQKYPYLSTIWQRMLESLMQIHKLKDHTLQDDYHVLNKYQDSNECMKS